MTREEYKKLRQVKVDGDVAYIPLPNGMDAVIDSSDVHLVSGVVWKCVISKKKDGSIRAVYACRRIGGKNSCYLHRILLGVDKGVFVDHVDGNGLNNRRNNLRVATHAQNMHNSSKQINNKSGHKGVYWSKKHMKWHAQITLNYKKHHIGYFDSLEMAANAYSEKSKELHKEFGTCR